MLTQLLGIIVVIFGFVNQNKRLELGVCRREKIRLGEKLEHFSKFSFDEDGFSINIET